MAEHLSERLRDLWMNKMAASKEAREIAEMTAEEAALAMTIEDSPESTEIVAEIPKSPRTLRLRKINSQ